MTTTDDLIILLGKRITEQNAILQDMALSLQQLMFHVKQFAISSNPGPNYRKNLAEFRNFDWSQIGAEIVKSDADGVSAVEWNGRLFTRRSPSNKFDTAIWFSRCVGKDDAGNNRYEKLITFKNNGDAEELSGKARKLITEELCQ